MQVEVRSLEDAREKLLLLVWMTPLIWLINIFLKKDYWV